MPVYKNLTDQDLMLPGIGICKANGTIPSPTVIENKNFELVEDQAAAPQAPAPAQPNPQPAVGGTK